MIYRPVSVDNDAYNNDLGLGFFDWEYLRLKINEQMVCYIQNKQKNYHILFTIYLTVLSST